MQSPMAAGSSVRTARAPRVQRLQARRGIVVQDRPGFRVDVAHQRHAYRSWADCPMWCSIQGG